MPSRVQAYDIRLPPFCFSFPPGPRPRPRCFPHCSTLLWYTAGVPREPGAHDGPAPSFTCHADAAYAILDRWLIRAHTSHLATTCGAQHPPNRLIRHAVITRDVTYRFPPLDTLEHSRPCRGRDLPARIRDGLRVARQRQKPRMVKGRAERIISG